MGELTKILNLLNFKKNFLIVQWATFAVGRYRPFGGDHSGNVREIKTDWYKLSNQKHKGKKT